MSQQFLNPLVKLCFGHVRHTPVEAQVVLRAKPLVKAGVFQQRARTGTDLGALSSRIEPEHCSPSTRRLDQAKQQPDGRRLASAVGSNAPAGTSSVRSSRARTAAKLRVSPSARIADCDIVI
jgi:hypothetical protein